MSLRANGSRECAPDDRLREAIHGAANAASEEWIASSPSPEGRLRRTRVLLAMTAVHDFAISPNAFFARHSFIPSLRIEGAGNAGRPMRPIAACAMVE